MTSENQSTAQFVRLFTIIWAALLAGQFFLVIILYFAYSITGTGSDTAELKEVFLFIVPLFMLAGIFGGNFLYKNQLLKIKELPTLKEKLMRYQSALIIRMAMSEGATILAAVVFYLTGDALFLGAAAIMLAWFVIIRPTRYKIAADLELNPSETATLFDTN
jgi:hypothetical protein